MRATVLPPTRSACETRCKPAWLAAALFAALLALGRPAIVSAEAAAAAAAGHAPSAQPAAPTGAPSGHETAGAPQAAGDTADAHTESHEPSPWGLVGKIFNFAVLVGVLVYFARQPFAKYLADRHAQIRDDLERAAEMKDEAGRQIADIEAKLKLLPAELDTLRARGRDEVAAEQARIEEAAAQERDRLLEQTRREIDAQLRTARRELVTHAADLAVQVARERIRHRITSDDQARLVDRYIAQVRGE